jgi:predicted XRE-type DNA-binding protein
MPGAIDMKNATRNEAVHVSTGNVFLHMGFSASEASVLNIKTKIYSAVLERVRTEGFTRAQLADILDENQSTVSNLMIGRISQVSMEKLLEYAYHLHLRPSVTVRAMKVKEPQVK